MNDILTTEAALFARLENAAKHHCVRTARARIRDIANLRFYSYSIDKHETIAVLTKQYINK